jgi:hypothetical protein
MTITTTMGIRMFASVILTIVGCPEAPASENIEEPTETGEPFDSDSDSGTDTDIDIDTDGNYNGYGDNAETSDSTDTGGDPCGDFGVQIDEECDGWNTAFETCETLGFAGGELGCHVDCTFDTSGCFESGCGNGIIEDPEICDGTPYPCWLLGYAGSTQADGLAQCGTDCTPNESACDPSCNWGDSGCFCWPATPCSNGEVCVPHPLFPNVGPGTCEPPSCVAPGEFCTLSAPNGFSCCPGLECVDYVCVP